VKQYLFFRTKPVPHSHPSSDRLRGSLRSGDTFPVPRLGVCLDTCHIWDGGYDIVNNLDGVLEEFDRIIGLDRLCALHLNDTKNPQGAKKDRHACIGEGYLGIDTFANIVNHPALKGKPMILETPNELPGYAQEIALLRSLENL